MRHLAAASCAVLVLAALATACGGGSSSNTPTPASPYTPAAGGAVVTPSGTGQAAASSLCGSLSDFQDALTNLLDSTTVADLQSSGTALKASSANLQAELQNTAVVGASDLTSALQQLDQAVDTVVTSPTPAAADINVLAQAVTNADSQWNSVQSSAGCNLTASPTP